MLPVMPHRRDRWPPRPAFVELHPLDDGSGLPPVFFEREAEVLPGRCGSTGADSSLSPITYVDPDTYTKHSSPDGRVDLWGLYEVRNQPFLGTRSLPFVLARSRRRNSCRMDTPIWGNHAARGQLRPSLACPDPNHP